MLLEPDEYSVLVTVSVDATLALARCGDCGTRPRVLPCDVLPRKPYTLAVIAHQCGRYSAGAGSLRSVCRELLGDRTPAHNTLHAWTEGWGAHRLGRPVGDVKESQPFSKLVAETRVDGVAASLTAEVFVDPIRFRSQPRCERLVALGQLLLCAQVATRHDLPRLALVEWRSVALGWGMSSPLVFRSGISCTPFEQFRPP